MFFDTCCNLAADFYIIKLSWPNIYKELGNHFASSCHFDAFYRFFFSTWQHIVLERNKSCHDIWPLHWLESQSYQIGCSSLSFLHKPLCFATTLFRLFSYPFLNGACTEFHLWWPCSTLSVYTAEPSSM
jgi:hypothetical protein